MVRFRSCCWRSAPSILRAEAAICGICINSESTSLKSAYRSADPADRDREIGGDAGRLEKQNSAAAMVQFSHIDGAAEQRLPAGNSVATASEAGHAKAHLSGSAV